MCIRAYLAHFAVEISDHSPNFLDTPCIWLEVIWPITSTEGAKSMEDFPEPMQFKVSRTVFFWDSPLGDEKITWMVTIVKCLAALKLC